MEKVANEWNGQCERIREKGWKVELITHKVDNYPPIVKIRLHSKKMQVELWSLSPAFQTEHPETLPRLGELGVQGDAKGDGPDREDDSPGCGFALGEHSPRSAVQMGERGPRLQPADGGQLHRQVGAEVPVPRPTHTQGRRLLICVWVILFHMRCSKEQKTPLAAWGGLMPYFC